MKAPSLRSTQQCRDSGLYDHWALRKGLIVGIRVCDNIDRQPFSSPSISLTSSLSLCLFSVLYRPVVSCVTFFLLLLPPSPPPPPCDLPVYLGKQTTAAGQELPNVSINILSTQSPRLTGSQQAVCS